jgi:4-amino-4-deoxy-L-arabinose transferase-like glycosyltransferase
MDWGYMEVPPLLSVFSWIALQLGNSFFWVQFWPALFGALTFFLCGDIILRQGGGRYALLLLFISLVFGAFIRVFFLFQPGFLEIFCWTAISWCLFRYEQSKQIQWLYAFGIACGLGMLSKYTTAFFLCGLVGGLLLTWKKTLLTQKHFYIAGIIGFLLFLPNLWWQYSHNFPVVHHMKELQETQLVYMDATGFVMGQIMMNFVVSYVWIAGLSGLLFTKSLQAYRLIAIGFFITLGLLLAGSGKDYYALGLYPILFAFGALQIEKFLQKRSVIYKVVIITITVALGSFILPLGLPSFKPEKLANYYEKTGFREALGFKWEDQKNHPLPQDFADMVGWRETAAMVAKSYNQLPDSVKRETIIFCRGYFTAGALNYYGPKMGLPSALSDNGSYLLWLPTKFSFKHLMLIGHKNPEGDDIVFNHFEKRSVMDSLSFPYFREDGIKVFFFKNGSDSMRYYANEGIRKERLKFNR